MVCSPFRTFSGGIGDRHFNSTDEAGFPVHTTVRIRPRPKNKPAFQPVDPPYARYTRAPERLQPPDCAPERVRRRTYSTEVTSFPSNLPLHRILRPLLYAQALIYYNSWIGESQEKFREIRRNFSCIFVKNAGPKPGPASDCRQTSCCTEKRVSSGGARGGKAPSRLDGASKMPGLPGFCRAERVFSEGEPF